MGQKKMSVKEFREQGYLQELNRQFLHPLGLALEVVKEKDGTERFGDVWDSRDDPEGIIYGPNMINPEKTKRIYSEAARKADTRAHMLGYAVQPWLNNSALGREVRVRDLKKGDVLLLGPDTQRTVKYCVPSSIDPVYLLGFEDSENQIAKAPDDLVRIEEGK